MFYSLMNRPKTIPVESGSIFKEVKELRIAPNGRKYLESVGKTNHYEKIQSFLAETDIKTLVSRYERGDLSALTQTVGQYIDCRCMPRNLAEAYKVLQSAEDVYSSLPDNLASTYSSFGDFINSFGSVKGIEDFLKGFYQPIEPNAPIEPIEPSGKGDDTK